MHGYLPIYEWARASLVSSSITAAGVLFPAAEPLSKNTLKKDLNEKKLSASVNFGGDSSELIV